MRSLHSRGIADPTHWAGIILGIQRSPGRNDFARIELLCWEECALSSPRRSSLRDRGDDCPRAGRASPFPIFGRGRRWLIAKGDSIFGSFSCLRRRRRRVLRRVRMQFLEEVGLRQDLGNDGQRAYFLAAAMASFTRFIRVQIVSTMPSNAPSRYDAVWAPASKKKRRWCSGGMESRIGRLIRSPL